MEDKQDKDLRYKIEHLGDSVVEMIEGVGHSITKRFRGIWLTRHIHSAQRVRNNVVYRIGERVVCIKKEKADLFADDLEMTGLFTEFEGAEKSLEEMIAEREERLDRIRGKIKDTMAARDNSEAEEFPEGMAAAPA